MYYYIIGLIKLINNNSIIIENNGIGYEIGFYNPYLFKINQKVKLFTYLYIKENIRYLYGFTDVNLLNFFKQIITIPGIGPKIAISLTQTELFPEIKIAIETDDINFLKQFPGIGDKTAQQIIWYLNTKNKNKKTNYILNPKQKDVQNALLNLGFDIKQINTIINKINTEKDIEFMIKESLQLLLKKIGIQMEKILKNKKDPKNKNEDTLLRPQTLQEYAGQEDIKHILNIYIQASRKRKETLDHLLFYGPPGLGKTTLARIIANELKTNIKITNGAILEKAGDLSAILSSLQTGEILFIDEIHRLPKTVEEILYSAMEDYALDIVIGKDYDRRTIRIKLSAFSLIGATTKFGHISFPLRDRFGLTLKLDYYKESELKTILQRTAKVYNNYIEEEALTELVKRSRGTPRIANRLFRRTRDFAEIYSNKVITHQITLETLKKLKIDENGLNETDYNYLNNLVFKFNGGPVGIKNLAATLGEEIFTIEEVYEPYLIQKGYIKRTPKGRIATNLTIKLLNKLNRKSI